MSYLLAVDGGGTSCRAAIANLDGDILGRATTGSANIATDPDGATASIIEAARRALTDSRLTDVRLEDIDAYLGLAGANVGSNDHDMIAHLPFRRTHIDDDANVALQGALGWDDGVLAVLGTGSVYIGRRGSDVVRVGGWGFMIGDLGSGARLGRALLQDTLLAYDRILPRSELTRSVLRDFGDDPNRMVVEAQSEKPGGFARFAPRVFEYADNGDEVGLALVKGAVSHVNAALAAVTWYGCQRLCLLGGLADLYKPRISESFRAILRPPKNDALRGAVELGIRHFHSVQHERTA